MPCNHLKALLFLLLAALVACLAEVVQQRTDIDEPLALLDLDPGEEAFDAVEIEDAPVDGGYDAVEADSSHPQVEFASHRFDFVLSAMPSCWIERELRPPRT
jgi:hypothetical protein